MCGESNAVLLAWRPSCTTCQVELSLRDLSTLNSQLLNRTRLAGGGFVQLETSLIGEQDLLHRDHLIWWAKQDVRITEVRYDQPRFTERLLESS